MSLHWIHLLPLLFLWSNKPIEPFFQSDATVVTKSLCKYVGRKSQRCGFLKHRLKRVICRDHKNYH